MGNCVVCGERCAPWERNADGTYLHTSCAMANAVWPDKRKKEETHE